MVIFMYIKLISKVLWLILFLCKIVIDIIVINEKIIIIVNYYIINFIKCDIIKCWSIF